MCIVVMVVVVIRVVVVSSSMGIRDRGFLDLDRPAADEGCKAVVRSPGEIAIPVDSVGPRPGTACVGLVVVPARSKALIQRDLQKAFTFYLNVNASIRPSAPVPKYSLLCRAAWIRSPGG